MPTSRKRPATKKASNPWVVHVQAYRSAHRCTFADALKGARPSYIRSKKTCGKASYRSATAAGKRNFDTFSEASAGRTDWLCDPMVKLDILDSVLKPPPAAILIPGIGHSTLGVDLMNRGYAVTVADLDEQQVSKTNRRLNPIYFNLLQGSPKEIQSRFDYVVDSSVTDVFMQLTSGSVPSVTQAKRVHESLCSMLNTTGTMIVFSMNNQPWKAIHKATALQRMMYLRIRPTFHIVTKRGRRTTKEGEDVLVIVASNTVPNPRRVTTDAAYASLTEWSDELPEDWRSQRA